MILSMNANPRAEGVDRQQIRGRKWGTETRARGALSAVRRCLFLGVVPKSTNRAHFSVMSRMWLGM